MGIPDIAQAMEPLFTTGDPEERSGLGFAVMQSFMDGVRVASHPARGTRVTMTKRLTAKGGGYIIYKREAAMVWYRTRPGAARSLKRI